MIARDARRDRSATAGSDRDPDDVPVSVGYGRDALTMLRRTFVATADMSSVIPPDVARRSLALSRQLHDLPPAETDVAVPLDDLIADRAVWQWGLTDGNLDLADWYLRSPARYLGVYVRREFANGQCLGERRWHIDIEDRHVLKLIIYLNDVGPDGGPFEYLDHEASMRVKHSIRYSSGHVDDGRMSSLVDPDHWHRVVGPCFTAAIADTSNLFHRARPPVATDTATR